MVPLTQWHIHDNLCFTNDPVAPHVAGLTDGSGNCQAAAVKLEPVPMIHVWITPNPCGPFAALRGCGRRSGAAGSDRGMRPRARRERQRRALQIACVTHSGVGNARQLLEDVS